MMGKTDVSQTAKLPSINATNPNNVFMLHECISCYSDTGELMVLQNRWPTLGTGSDESLLSRPRSHRRSRGKLARRPNVLMGPFLEQQDSPKAQL